ncbi:hypothetical protein [Limosilactobacillus fermentum]|uniref:hypothetical protein n=1 Tax=Limosilactobacillus fermentum TaxID=1613 RepID=UPI00165140D3|nr:hypothetical protein [Limosilactobacillus fermentum]MCZ2327116.1 hypothetical protein [Limosilactobacillus fermentum]
MTKLITCLALGSLIVAETLHDHFGLAMIALVPFWLIAMEESFPQNVKKPSGRIR